MPKISVPVSCASPDFGKSRHLRCLRRALEFQFFLTSLRTRCTHHHPGSKLFSIKKLVNSLNFENKNLDRSNHVSNEEVVDGFGLLGRAVQVSSRPESLCSTGIILNTPYQPKKLGKEPVYLRSFLLAIE